MLNLLRRAEPFQLGGCRIDRSTISVEWRRQNGFSCVNEALSLRGVCVFSMLQRLAVTTCTHASSVVRKLRYVELSFVLSHEVQEGPRCPTSRELLCVFLFLSSFSGEMFGFENRSLGWSRAGGEWRGRSVPFRSVPHNKVLIFSPLERCGQSV